ncbi:hypothetical protein E8E12_006176 [Didymella heteroderae]|uniref:Uncharacterized protein n=1 Tax=Didymella heteroderae TaxID=1769908 RepID=A0A9P4WPR8_9PLEO|nr:hypothetical protein E8E12_006176 [Didymella heteroderae]
MSDYPLEAIADVDLQNLGKRLWKWQLCSDCDGMPDCKSLTCPWSRRDRIQPVLRRYERLCSYYMPDVVKRPALRRHQDLLNIMRLIQDRPNETKEQLMAQHFVSPSRPIPTSDQERAFNLAVSVLLSLNCGVPNDCADNLEESADSFPWASGLSVTQFVDAAVERGTNGIPSQYLQSFISSELSARQLSSKAGIRFEATDDIRSHLRLDLSSRVVYIFDCTAALEETLSATRQSSQRSILPRALLLEILHTIYKVLFPPGRESKRFAKYLTKRCGFEKNFLRYRIRWYGRDDDPDVDFSYFGERLKELNHELNDPSPRNWFERLFEGGTRSAERKMLMATTIGVIIAVTIGLFGLVIAGFQAWVGYQQWKHPIKDS